MMADKILKKIELEETCSDVDRLKSLLNISATNIEDENAKVDRWIKLARNESEEIILEVENLSTHVIDDLVIRETAKQLGEELGIL